MNYNTIILLRGERAVTEREFKKLETYSTILGDLNDPEELMRWSADDEESARAELSKRKCSYNFGNLNYILIEEYALKFCELDEDGEDVGNIDYDFAEILEIGK